MIILQNNGQFNIIFHYTRGLTELYYPRTDRGRPWAAGAPADGIMLA